MKNLTKEQTDDLMNKLEIRFNENMVRHPNIKFGDISMKIKDNKSILLSLYKMEETNGEPDVVCFNEENNEYYFIDCSKESPSGRRSLCYDKKALDSRKNNKPVDNVIDVAKDIGIELLDEADYRKLQSIDEFDLKTSSWIKTDDDIRDLGGAIFCDRRYNKIFKYHNGAESYYSSRGFRGKLKI